MWRTKKTKLILGETGGFSYLEVLGAIILVGLISTALLPLFSQLLSSQSLLTTRTELLLLARGKLREITTGAEPVQEGFFPSPWSGSQWRYTEEKISEHLIRQNLTVQWRENQHEHRVTVSRLQAN